MRRAGAEIPHQEGQWERSMWHNLAKTLRGLRRSLGESGGSYRPDLHYMRGPGPKWRAKYGNLAPTPQPPRAIASEAMLRAARRTSRVTPRSL
jgi:hypothetical protein